MELKTRNEIENYLSEELDEPEEQDSTDRVYYNRDRFIEPPSYGYYNVPHKNSKNDEIIFHRESTEVSEIDDILGKRQHLFLSKINKNNLKCRQSFTLNVKKIKKGKLLKEYLSTFGNVIIYKDDIIIIEKDDIIYSVYYFKNYESMQINVYGNSVETTYEGYNIFKNHIADLLCVRNLENVDLTWYLISNGRSTRYVKNEVLDDIFFSESYPYINCEEFIKNYLESDEPVLILIGPPGTGKTRFIRHILKRSFNKITRDNKDNINCLFTSSKEIIDEGKIYMDLIFSDSNFLVLEDIDYHLKPRTGGNSSLYNLLSVSNGLLSNAIKDKKIILSTNLPNVKDIDDALLRPGRCFDIVNTRRLNKLEAEVVAKLIGRNNLPDKKSYSLAEIYNKKES